MFYLLDTHAVPGLVVGSYETDAAAVTDAEKYARHTGCPHDKLVVVSSVAMTHDGDDKGRSAGKHTDETRPLTPQRK